MSVDELKICSNFSSYALTFKWQTVDIYKQYAFVKQGSRVFKLWGRVTRTRCPWASDTHIITRLHNANVMTSPTTGLMSRLKSHCYKVTGQTDLDLLKTMWLIIRTRGRVGILQDEQRAGYIDHISCSCKYGKWCIIYCIYVANGCRWGLQAGVEPSYYL